MNSNLRTVHVTDLLLSGSYCLLSVGLVLIEHFLMSFSGIFIGSRWNAPSQRCKLTQLLNLVRYAAYFFDSYTVYQSNNYGRKVKYNRLLSLVVDRE